MICNNKAGRKAVKAASSVISFTVLAALVLLTAFTAYAVWDSWQIYEAADKAQYAVYKPTVKSGGKTFAELQAANGEVIAWLCVYGTNIDYPVTQCEDNMKYVNTNAQGEYSLSGSIFLDAENSNDFTDFNSILYGHHMEKHAMFGEIGNFSDKNVFASHEYGNLYVNGENRGIEFFAFVHTDAYNMAVFKANVKDNHQEYLDNLLSNAVHKRDADVSAEDSLILLSTCSSASTNGRDILVGKITRETYKDRFEKTEPGERKTIDIEESFSLCESAFIPAIIILAISVAALILIIYLRRKKRGEP